MTTALQTKPKTEKPTQQSDRYAGRIVGIFGLQGELKCDPTSAGRTVFIPGATLRCEAGGTSSEIKIESLREHKDRLLVRLAGITTADAAQRLSGAKLYAPRTAFVLSADEYLDEDLVGSRLIDASGAELGRVDAIEHYPGQDLLVAGSARIPMVRAFIVAIDIKEKRITVDLPLGLLEPSQAEEA